MTKTEKGRKELFALLPLPALFKRQVLEDFSAGSPDERATLGLLSNLPYDSRLHS